MGLALATRVVQQGDVGVGVHVDESRRYYVARGVDSPRRLDAAERAYGLDPAVRYANVAPVSGRAGAVHDDAVQDQDVKCHGCPPEIPMRDRAIRPDAG